jgi:glycine/D-amino acid oxidase-like deaminating enzyme
MSKNRSPWIHQLNPDRPTQGLSEDIDTDVAIVGGGIAGVATAYFLVKNTDKKVVLVEGGRLGHGATGHNAGQVTSYFARSLHDIAREFGVEMAVEAQRSIEENAWELLDKVYTEAGLDFPFSRFMGHLGITNKEHLISLLKDNVVRKEGGLQPKSIFVVEGADFIPEIEKDFAGLYITATLSEIQKRLETHSKQFIACLSEQKGCLNSALFAEQVSQFLMEASPNRFRFFEHTHINRVVLHDDHALLDAEKHTVRASRVILATNGFDSLSIYNKSGLDIDTRFHHDIHGIVGYMSGYMEDIGKPPVAISYFTDSEAMLDAPYMYMTRRPYEYNENKHNLISIGGPELDLENRNEYERDHEYPEWARDEIDKFVKEIYRGESLAKDEYIFTWHGLMGYTPNKLRIIGSEPRNPILLYNLGCNGVGILPSIYGADRISKIISGEKPKPSIFDPKA